MDYLYNCGTVKRRAAVRGRSDVNGIDFLKISGDLSPRRQPGPFRIALHLLNPLGSTVLRHENFVLSRQRDGAPLHLVAGPTPSEATGGTTVVSFDVAAAGAAAVYTLRLCALGTRPEPPGNFDSQLAAVDFTLSFEPVADLEAEAVSAPAVTEPEIDYLAKDYLSFRRLMLDRMGLLLPGGIDDRPADLQVALVELLAYTADRLSYAQDTVATEAYLGTARSRISLRRHARLLNYRLHEGCNARVWVRCQVTKPMTVGKLGQPDPPWQFLTRGAAPLTFEPCHSPALDPTLNDDLHFYAWGESDVVLPAGATTATLDAADALAALTPGSGLLFQTLSPIDPPLPRHVVRLTGTRLVKDRVANKSVVQIDWGSEDALPFDLPVCAAGQAVAAACGNLVLADHGQTLQLALDPSTSRWQLPKGPLTYAEPLPADLAAAGNALTSAAKLSARAASLALPQIIALKNSEATWTARRDLLASAPEAADYVVETEADGTARLRFGDGVYYGRKPARADFTIAYRVGNGPAGNIGPNAIGEVVEVVGETRHTLSDVKSVSNPLPGWGGQDPEPAEQVRLFAPQAFHAQARAVNVEDYAARAAGYPGVQRANADFRWTGSWYTVYLFVDRTGGAPLTDDFKQGLSAYLDTYRLAGYDLEIRGATYVPLAITFTVELKPSFAANAVAADVETALGPRGDLPGGRRGYFHPDNWSFGQPVYLSGFYKAVLDVPGVAAVNVSVFERPDAPGRAARNLGQISIGPHEIVSSTIDIAADGLTFTVEGTL